jgi:hypothetical protein
MRPAVTTQLLPDSLRGGGGALAQRVAARKHLNKQIALPIDIGQLDLPGRIPQRNDKHAIVVQRPTSGPTISNACLDKGTEGGCIGRNYSVKKTFSFLSVLNTSRMNRQDCKRPGGTPP